MAILVPSCHMAMRIGWCRRSGVKGVRLAWRTEAPAGLTRLHRLGKCLHDLLTEFWSPGWRLRGEAGHEFDDSRAAHGGEVSEFGVYNGGEGIVEQIRRPRPLLLA